MKTLRVTVVNHARIEIDRPASTVWAMLVRDYGQGGGFERAGYRVEALDEAGLHLGGYRLHYETAELTDERICRVTERDEAAMRLSLHADYLANAMIVYATYQAVPTGAGTLYLLDCHSTLDHDVREGATREEIHASIAELGAKFDGSLATSLARIKTELEAAGRAA